MKFFIGLIYLETHKKDFLVLFFPTSFTPKNRKNSTVAGLLVLHLNGL